MQGLYHLFKLPDPDVAVVRVGGVAALGHVVVQWVIAPIVLISFGFGFINRIEIKRWQKYGCA